MTKSKRIKLDPSKLLGIRHLKNTITRGKINMATAMIGGGKVCTTT